jgi:large subunit ribosomal protein L32
LRAATTGLCPQCQEPKAPHRICPHCGYYNSRPVRAVDEE